MSDYMYLVASLPLFVAVALSAISFAIACLVITLAVLYVLLLAYDFVIERWGRRS